MSKKKNKNGVIYCLTSPSGRKYVGQSWHWKTRMSTYKTALYHIKHQIKLYRAIKKYGFDKFKFEILEDGLQTQEDMDDRECHWIEKFNCLVKGYNIKAGGYGGKHSKESIRKNRYSNSRYEYTITHPDGTVTKTKSLNEFCEIHNLNKQSMHKMASGKQKFYGNWKVTRRKLKTAKGIRILTQKDKLKIKKSHEKYEYILTSPSGEVFITMNLSDFSRKHGLLDSMLSCVVRGKRKHHKGWTGNRRLKSD